MGMAFSFISFLLIFLTTNIILNFVPLLKVYIKFATVLSFFVAWLTVGLIIPARSLQYYMDNSSSLYLLELIVSVLTIIIVRGFGKMLLNSK